MKKSEFWKNFKLGKELDISGRFIYNGLQCFHQMEHFYFEEEIFEFFYNVSVGIERLLNPPLVALVAYSLASPACLVVVKLEAQVVAVLEVCFQVLPAYLVGFLPMVENSHPENGALQAKTDQSRFLLATLR